MSLAPVAYTLFQRIMRHDPADPDWLGRDRFVLSAGHSSLTLYLQLYLSGYGLELDDLKALRTWGSLTPGHPEHGHTAGVHPAAHDHRLAGALRSEHRQAARRRTRRRGGRSDQEGARARPGEDFR